VEVAPIQTPDALLHDPHLNAVGLFETVDTKYGPVRFPGVPTWFSRTPGHVSGFAPELGADTDDVLAKLNPLGQRQLGGVVDGVGGAPHVGLPRV
jgi:crotonobetainyl-CoA:carnitine CoA-transferase CaiB-like acyl-CoA transferase